MRRSATKKTILHSLLSGEAGRRYRGKQVMIFDGRVYSLPENDRQAAALVRRVMEKHPSRTPLLAFVPRKET